MLCNSQTWQVGILRVHANRLFEWIIFLQTFTKSPHEKSLAFIPSHTSQQTRTDAHNFRETKSICNSRGLLLKCQPGVLKGSDSFLMLHVQSCRRGRETGLMGIRCNFGNCFGSWWLTIQKKKHTRAERLPRETSAQAAWAVWLKKKQKNTKDLLTFVHEDHWSWSAPSASQQTCLKVERCCYSSVILICALVHK